MNTSGTTECPHCLHGRDMHWFELTGEEIPCDHCNGTGEIESPPAKATPNTPTEAGWYWFEGEVHPEFYDTWEYAGFVELYANEEEPPELIVVFASYMDAEPVESVSGTWYGPIDVERIKAMHSGAEEVDPVYGVGWAQ